MHSRLLRTVVSRVWVAMVAVMVNIGMDHVCWASPTTVLTVTLEDSVFLEGQSVYCILRLRNAGKMDVVDVAPLALSARYFRPTLVRKETGEALRSVVPQVKGNRAKDGPTLRPGAIQCVATDLSLHFGVIAENPANLSTRLGYPSLPVGEYLLRWEYSIHTGHREGVVPEAIAGGGISFSVRPLSSAPGEQALVGDFLGGLPIVRNDRRPLHSYARNWLPRFYGSKYLMRIYLSTGQLLNDLDFDQIYKQATLAGSPPERLATLLGVRLSMTDTRGQFTSTWKRSMAPRMSSQLERDVLSIEPREK